MEKNNKTKFNIAFLIVCFLLTLFYVFHGQNPKELLGYIQEADVRYWIAGVGFIVLYIFMAGVVIFYNLKALKKESPLSDASMGHCFLFAFVGFFFNLVTPLGSGGQPAQMVYMKKDGIPLHISTLIMIIITIAFKSVLVIFGLGVIIIRPKTIVTLLQPVWFWIYLGMLLNSAVIVGFLMMIYKPDLAKRFIMWCFRKLRRIARSPKVDSFEVKVNIIMDNYKDAAVYVKSHRNVILNVIWISIVQRIIIFFTTYLVLKSFGVVDVGIVEAIVLQAMINLSTEMLPIPGGMGISEHLFHEIFLPVCGAALITPTMIVSRGLAYYTQLLLSALLTIVAHFVIVVHKDNKASIRKAS